MRIGKWARSDSDKRSARGGGKAGSASREFVSDDEITGFGVRCQADGSASFLVKYRGKGDTRQRFVTRCAWPVVHPDTAREKARGRASRDLSTFRKQAQPPELRRAGQLNSGFSDTSVSRLEVSRKPGQLQLQQQTEPT